ncbi:hypothetical protein RJT34_16924 [Clitoria ternatea]|uniref:Uncharacterized protein n=1 Tax=Clitoria ternatea TaxID=43366 RepID=A0AAN9J998_CLITE
MWNVKRPQQVRGMGFRVCPSQVLQTPSNQSRDSTSSFSSNGRVKELEDKVKHLEAQLEVRNERMKYVEERMKFFEDQMAYVVQKFGGHADFPFQHDNQCRDRDRDGMADP